MLERRKGEDELIDRKALLNPDEVCDILYVTDTTLKAWRNKYPDFPFPSKFGQGNFYDETEILAWKENHPELYPKGAGV